MKLHKFFSFVLIAGALALFAASCGSDDDDDPVATEAPAPTAAAPAPTEAPAPPLRIAIVSPSASNDLAFSQSISDGVNALGDDRNIDVAITCLLYTSPSPRD